MKKTIRQITKRILTSVAMAAVVASIIPTTVLAQTDSTATSTTTVTVDPTTTNYQVGPDGVPHMVENGGNVHVTQNSTYTSKTVVTDPDRDKADEELLNYMNSMMIQYDLNKVQQDKLGDLFNSAVYYIAYTELTQTQLDTYVASIKADMQKVASTDVSATTSEYLQVADNWKTPTVGYGQRVTIVLPIINIGIEELRDIVIEPAVNNDVKSWPFDPDTTGYIQTEPFIPGYVNDDQAFANRREFTYTFTVRDDVMTGYYPLDFKVSYTRNGERVENDKAAKVTVYVQTIGKPESGYIGGNGNEDKMAKPRIIVTGYETDVDKIYSGDTFNLTIHVQNTSSTVTVTNILFQITGSSDLHSYSSASNGSGGSSSTSEWETPFLPTSGSNSIYMEKIAPKEVADIKIEMSAKPGLAQKSYAIELDMTYDAQTKFDLTDNASISIPVYQDSKFDTSNPEVSPMSIDVGGQANVMFSIYNTGKTGLYNVQVYFEADSIENNMAYVGNVASGATGNVDVMLTGVAGTMDDGTIKVNIQYEDEAGNESVVEKTVNLYVNEFMEEYDNPGRRDIEIEEEPKGVNPTVIKIIIVAVIIIILIILILFIIKKRAAKREAFLKEEDLKDLEALEDKDSNSGNN